MSYRVVFTPEAEEQLAALYRYIAAAAAPSTAERYVSAIRQDPPLRSTRTVFPNRSP